MIIEYLKQQFSNPTKEYRSAPFWSWNDRLDPDEIAWQIRNMKKAGIGGFFMHSREGLETPFMSEEWMRCVKAAVDSAKEMGMDAWLYDEDRWPSGFGGGMVAAKIGDEGRAKLLTLVELEPGQRVEDVLSAFYIQLTDDKITYIEPIAIDDVVKEGVRAIAFKREICTKSDWFNGEAYADNLNPKSVRAFIESVYEPYYERFGDEFGKTIPGIFTDEPNIFSGHNPGMRGVPWTDVFPQYFEQKRGYNIVALLPYLFFDGDKSTEIRHDYWRTISELFAEAYSKQLGQWCDEHGIGFTGHYLYENEFASAIRCGGSIMPHYQYEHQPGIDILTESINETLTVKQCSSVANQFGRTRVVSELYGCTGWDFTFEGQKWVGDWQYALGVNLRCQHLALYSLRGCRKRDYPGSYNYNNTWWKYNKVVEDYFGRLSLVLSSGKVKRDILVIHPIESAWCRFNGSNDDEVNAMGQSFQALCDGFLGLHRDFDLGDESIMEAYGRVENGDFVVNQAKYKTVIVPPMLTMRRATASLLQSFMDNGGKVIFVRPCATMVDARGDDALAALFGHQNAIVVDNDLSVIEDVLSSILERHISITDRAGQQDEALIYMQRCVDDGQAFFVVNTDRNNSHKVRIKLKGNGHLEQWNALTADIKPIAADIEGGYMAFDAEFAPAASMLYIMDTRRPPANVAPYKPKEVDARYVGPVCEFARTDPNVLTLDYCQYRFDSEDWSPFMQVWQAQDAIRKRLDMRSIAINGLEQRWRWIYTPHPNDGAHVQLRFAFDVNERPLGHVYFVVEGSEDFYITFDDMPISNEPHGWFLDKSFNKIELPLLIPGRHEVELSCRYKNSMELEDCYIIGNFGVDMLTKAIISEPERIHFGDWCSQGYPNYPGSMIYKENVEFYIKEGQRVYINLGEYRAITTAVWINGNIAVHIPWRAANGADITEFLHDGLNEIGIELVSSPRNMLGPLHQKSGKKPWTDSRSFRTTGYEFTPDEVLVPQGCFGQIKLSIVE